MPTMPRLFGPWINLPERWISQPCFAILWPRWPSYLKPRLTSVTTFLGVLIPPCPNWKSPFAKVCYQQKRTTWSQVVIPKTVKHPLDLGDYASTKKCYKILHAVANRFAWPASFAGCLRTKVRDINSGDFFRYGLIHSDSGRFCGCCHRPWGA